MRMEPYQISLIYSQHCLEVLFLLLQYIYRL
nr:MAG TPA: hypothetical protein [Caudoviricetes sp.]